MHIRRSLIAVTLALALLMSSAASWASVAVEISIAPPELPIYVQPPVPAPGYLWIPGYWAWSGEDYYWVPGTWVLPPRVGLLWTPGYWRWVDSVYIWSPGYWSPHVGFYGGVDYGCGYFGTGYEGGYWDHDRFYYNRAVDNLGAVHITNVYSRTVINNITVNRVSYNGGAIGTQARPTQAELYAAREHHMGAEAIQLRNQQQAMNERQLHASVNRGLPPITATRQPDVPFGHGIASAYRGQPQYVPSRPRSIDTAHVNRTAPQAPAMIARYRDAPGNSARPERVEGALPSERRPVYVPQPRSQIPGPGYARGLYSEAARPSSPDWHASRPAFSGAPSTARQTAPGFVPTQRPPQFRPSVPFYGRAASANRTAYPARQERAALERQRPNFRH